MATSRQTRPRSATDRAEQLTLLSPSDAPQQFRLDERTRCRGLAHIQQIRAQLAALAEQRPITSTPVRRRAA